MTKSGIDNVVRPMPAGGRRCAICGKPATARHQPFCSARCANIDLGRWLNGAYRVGTDEPADDEPPAESG